MRCALAQRLAVALGACLCLPGTALAVRPAERHTGRALFDVREGRPPARPLGSARARLQLDRALGPGGVIAVDPLTGGPRVVAKLGGFLSAPASGDPAALALGYVRAHAAALGLGAGDLARLRLVRRYTTPDGVTHLAWAQTYRGIPAFDNDLRANVAANGQVVNVLGSPRGGLSVPSTRPRVGRRRAVAGKGRLVGRPRLVLFGEQRGARLAWRFQARRSPTRVYDYVVDASSAKVLRRANKVSFANALAFEYYPGAASGGTQASQSLDPWLSAGATTLVGPNAHAYLDPSDTGTPTEVTPGSYAFTPVSSPSGLCPSSGCAWNHLSPSTYTTNEEEAANQAFYYVNKFHDHLAAAPISFAQFQGTDKVKVEVDDGVLTGPDDDHIDNANFTTPPAGFAPTMQMYLFGKYGFSDVNGVDDATVVYHEYTHGLSNRLVTDAAGYGALDTVQSGALGEAWSDWYAMDFLANQGHVSGTSTNGSAVVGTYTDGGGHLIRYQGIDCPVGSTAAGGCPGSSGAGQGGFTYADFGRVGAGTEVHADGEIWAETLWDLRRRLIADHPGDGAERTEMLVTHAMDLAPPEPSFIDMRNAILQEDSVAYGGAHQAAIWEVFAQRGMGWFASTTDSSDTAPVADFSTPPSGGGAATVSGRVTDADTHAGLGGATAAFGGTGLTGTTDATGAYAIAGVPAGTYPQMIVSAAGYDRSIRSVSVPSGQAMVDVALRRDWAASAGGAAIAAMSGSYYPGCGPYEAIDQSPTTGWSADVGAAQSIVVSLPQAVDVSAFGINPAGICGDDGSSALGAYRVDVSKDADSWTQAASGSFGSADRGRVNEVPATGGKGTRFVRLTMLSPQSSAGSGAQYMDVAELEVFGVTPGFGQPTRESAVPPPGAGGAVGPTKPPLGLSVSVSVGTKQKLKTLLKRGLPVTFTCSSRCTGAASLRIKRKSLGASMHELVRGGRGRVVVRVSKRAVKKSLRKGRRWKLALRLVVTGPAGRRSFSKSVTVSR